MFSVETHYGYTNERRMTTAWAPSNIDALAAEVRERIHNEGSSSSLAVQGEVVAGGETVVTSGGVTTVVTDNSTVDEAGTSG